MENKKLSELINWKVEKPTHEPLPTGEYECEATRGETFTSKGGHPGYKITWQVQSGEHKGRLIFQDLYFTAAAKNITNGHLVAMNVATLQDLEDSIPGLVCNVKVSKKANFNDVEKVNFIKKKENPFPYKSEEKLTNEPEDEMDSDEFFDKLKRGTGD